MLFGTRTQKMHLTETGMISSQSMVSEATSGFQRCTRIGIYGFQFTWITTFGPG
ncbi:uncharacterized protein DS421_5g147320 [Arachis hypogaea]|nr:uncharacterized protein DS421_5g147320 [Arachis hypogaea]